MLNQANYRVIDIEKRPDGVAIARFNRPERLNAIDGDLHHELMTLPRDASDDREVRVLLITGAGRSFSSGGDVSAGAARYGSRGVPALQEARRIIDHMLECEKPIISAVNGYAMGLGANVALLADVVVAAESAVFGETHVLMGVGAGDGGQLIWPLLVGVNRAKYYLMTGEHLDAREAERIGLVNFVVPDHDLMPRALGIAERLARGPAKAISASKMAINHWMRSVSALVMPISLGLETASMASPDHREAVQAFAEKREPQFRH
jgi:enoyl-CoA hydratase